MKKADSFLLAWLGLAPLLICGAVPASAQDNVLPPDALKRVSTYFEGQIKARYMEQGQDCHPVTYPGWDDFKQWLERCRYTVKDKDGTAKTAEVIMLNPTPDQLARWVVYACLEAKGKADKGCTGSLSRRIIEQSGAQFPVAGLVFEDILPHDGVFEMYAFRDGVTVSVNGVHNTSTHQPSNAEIEQAIDGQVTGTGKFARLQGTIREEYRANGGSVDVGTSAHRKKPWHDVSRALYQAAWGHDKNELMIAWAQANL